MTSFSATVQRLNPPAQTSLDDLLTAIEEAADDQWWEMALSTLRRVCESQNELTTDDLWEHIDASGESTHERRAMGPLMKAGEARGWCVPTDRVRNSSRPICHTRPLRIWQSLLRPL